MYPDSLTVKGKWLNCSDDEPQPGITYFDNEKLKKWIYSCELFDELSFNLSGVIQSSYADFLEKQNVECIIGKLIYDKLVNISIINDSKIRDKLAYMINKAANRSKGDFFDSLLSQLKKHQIKNAKKDEKDENKPGEDDKPVENENNNDYEESFESDQSEIKFKKVMKSDDAIKLFLVNVNNYLMPIYIPPVLIL